MHTHIGTSGFSYPAWKPSFYPEGLPASKMLGFYASRFSAVEINNTFYRMPSAKGLAEWAGQVPEGFRFALKAPQRITHIQRLKDSRDSVTYFFSAAEALGERLGPALFQLPPNLKCDVPRLADFLALLPKSARVAFEFRHASWFQDQIYELLKRYGVALTWAETEDLETPHISTAGWGYARLRKEDYSEDELKAWAGRLGGAGWAEAFVFFKHEDAGKAPAFAARLIGMLGA